MFEDVPTGAADMVEAERESLAGALAVIYWGAVVVLLVPVIGLGSFAMAAGRGGLTVLLGQTVIGSRVLVAALPVLALVVWAAAFVTMTTVRARSAPLIASVLFTVWGLTSIGSQIGLQVLLLPDGPSLATIGPMLPAFAANVICIAAFCGYMRGGDRPRRFFVGS